MAIPGHKDAPFPCISGFSWKCLTLQEHMLMETQTGIDIFSASFKDHAFASYADLRETDPVLSVALPNEQTLWLVP